MIFALLNKKEFIDFSEVSLTRNFFQSINMYNRYIDNGDEAYLVGVKKDNKVLMAGIIVARKKMIFGYKVFNCYKGFIGDYDDNVIKFMSENIKRFIKEKHGLVLFIDPYIVSKQRDIDGLVIDNGIDNTNISNYLIEYGYNYLDEYEQVKWTFCLDLNKSSKELFKDFKSNTRNLINKTINKYMINIRVVSYDKLEEFKRITYDTSFRKGFSDKSFAYYKSMFREFSDDLLFLIASINCDKYIDSIKNKIADEKKKTMVKNNIIDNLNKEIFDISLLKEQYGNIIDLSCGMFMLWGDEIVYLFSGSYKELMKYCGQYAIQWYIIKYGVEHKYRRYNFYGIKDIFNKESSEYGIYEFKKGFNGYVEETLGTFALPINILGKLYINKIRLFKKLIKNKC